MFFVNEGKVAGKLKCELTTCGLHQVHRETNHVSTIIAEKYRFAFNLSVLGSLNKEEPQRAATQGDCNGEM